VALIDCYVPDAGGALSSSVISAYLRSYTDEGDLVLDPFCTSPALAEEAIAQGRSAIAINVNPLEILRVRGALGQLTTEDVVAALTRLGDASKSGTTMRRHIQSLYQTTCPLCAGEASAEYYVWERDGQAPLQVRYRCGSCGAAGMRHCDATDAETAAQIPTRGLHYWHIVDRVAKDDEEARALLEELLPLYTSRNLYSLSNLILKAENLFADGPAHDAVRWLLLWCLERGSKLQTVPGEAEATSVRRLQPPQRFAEWNVWHLLEQSLSELLEQPALPLPIRSSIRAVLDETVGAAAFIGHMSVRTLVRTLEPERVRLIIGEPLSMGKMRWALPYLWTGCLYGSQDAAALWPFVQSKASHWWWYTRAVQATLRALRDTMRPDGRILLAGRGKETSFHEAVALAAAGAGWETESAVMHLTGTDLAAKPFGSTAADYRIGLAPGHSGARWPIAIEAVLERVGEVAAEAAEQTLLERAEPVPFSRLHCSIWRTLAQRGVLQRFMSLRQTTGSPLDTVRQRVREALTELLDRVLVQVWADEKQERCLWWLRDDGPAGQPLMEQVEDAVQEVLASEQTLSTADLESRVYGRFPGNMTPDGVWMEACLKSYATETAPGQWEMNILDRPRSRVQQRKSLVEALTDLGQRLSMAIGHGEGGTDVLWSAADGTRLGFTVLDTVALSSLVQSAESLADMRKYAVVLASRHDLLRERLSRSPVLAKSLADQGWQLIAQSAVEQWQAQPQVDVADIEYLVIQDLLEAHSRPHLPLL
jgi:hypothetical protein